MPRWWPRPSPALDGGRARAATGAWLPGTSIASVVEELKLDCTTLQLQRCAWLRACRMQRPSEEGAAPLHTHMLHGSSNQKERKKKLLKLQDTAKGMYSLAKCWAAFRALLPAAGSDLQSVRSFRPLKRCLTRGSPLGGMWTPRRGFGSGARTEEARPPLGFSGPTLAP